MVIIKLKGIFTYFLYLYNKNKLNFVDDEDLNERYFNNLFFYHYDHFLNINNKDRENKFPE